MAYDGYYLTYKADKETNERFDEIREKYPSFRMVKINLEDWADPKIEQAITKIATITNTKHFWIVDPDVKVDDDFDFSFETDDWDENLTHVWNCDERNVFRSVVGVKLFKTKDVKTKKKSHIKDAYYLTGEYKEHKTGQVNYTPTTETYDIFFWDKGYGYKELDKLKEKYTVNVVEGKTSLAVHKKCRKQTRTDFYYLIMPNTKIYDSFKFDYSFAFGLDKEKQKVVVWQKENPETNLSREYHGVGLFPKSGPLFTNKEYDIFNFKRKAVYEKEPASSDLPFEVIRTTDLHTFNHESDSDMYWLVHENVENFNSDFYPMNYDRVFVHNFNVKLANSKDVCNGVRLIPTINATIDKQKDVNMVVGSIPKLEGSILEATIDKSYQYKPDSVGHPVFYFDEGKYSSNTEKYKKDKTVEVLTGPLEKSYMKAAKLTKTKYFWAIDNDVDVLGEFDRTIYVDKYHKSHFHVWPKINP